MSTSSGASRHRQSAPGRPADVYAHPVLRVGAAVVAVGSGVLSTAPAGSFTDMPVLQRNIELVDNWNLDGAGVLAAVRDTALSAAPMTFDQSMYYLFNDMLGIGGKSVSELFSGAGTVGEVLAVSGLDVSTTLGSTNPNLMALLGLDDIKLETILDALGLNSVKSFDAILDQLSLDNVTLDFLLTPLGMASTQTTLGLAHRFSVAHLTLGEMLGRAGFSPNDTLGGLLNRLGLGGTALPGLMGFGGLVGNMTCPTSMGAGMTLDQFLQCLTLDATGDKNGAGNDTKGHAFPPQIHVNKNTTIEQLLTSQHFYDANSNHTSKIIGNWTLGEILSQKAGSPSIPAGQTPFIWNTATTVKDLIDHIHVNTGVTSDQQGGVPSMIFPFGSGSGSGSGVNEQSPGNDNGGTAVPPGSTSQMLPTLGSINFGDILRWINLDPNASLADIITGKFWVGDHLAGSSTIGDILNGMIVDPLQLGPIGTHVTDSTTISDLLDGMGWGSQTLNDLFHLTP